MDETKKKKKRVTVDIFPTPSRTSGHVAWNTKEGQPRPRLGQARADAVHRGSVTLLLCKDQQMDDDSVAL